MLFGSLPNKESLLSEEDDKDIVDVVVKLLPLLILTFRILKWLEGAVKKVGWQETGEVP